ncbi:MAG: PKD domain-containing protein [Thermoplasmata archaeon]|nr:MAG: PKD domain-containing protein [Thermoplasmata archaeon]
MKIISIITIILILPLSNLAIIAADPEPGVEDEPVSNPSSRAVKKWSVFVYVDGDNNLERFAIEDVNEMERVGSTADVNIVIQFDRVNGYNKSNGDWTWTRRYYVTKDDHPININSQLLGDDLGELNMADPITLQNFLEWGMDNYPAEHYLVVMWDHGRGIFRSSGSSGGGLFKGFNEDLTSSPDEMRLWELDEIMLDLKEKNGGKNIDIVGFDQCWLGNIETAYELMDSTDYLIASADEEPDKGWNYEVPLQTLVDNPDISPAEFAIKITNDYVKEYENKTSYAYMTQATIDLKEVQQTYVPLMNDLSDLLIDNFYDIDDTLYGIRQTLTDYYYHCPDLYYFIKLVQTNVTLPEVIRNAAANLIANYSKSVIAEGHGADHPNGNGLSIYFPNSLAYDPYSTFQSKYDTNIDYGVERWAEFLHMFHDPLRIDHTALKDTEDMENPYLIESFVYGHLLNQVNVKLNYALNDSKIYQVNMTITENSTFAAYIPAQPKNTDVYYYLSTSDTLGNKVYLPHNAPNLDRQDFFNFFVGDDITPPTISHTPFGDKIYSKQDFEIIATVTDNIAVDSSRVMLYYRTDSDKDYVELTMTPYSSGVDRYRSFIPSQLIGTKIYYHFKAQDDVTNPNTQRLPETGDFQFSILGLIINVARDRYHTDYGSDYDKLFKMLIAPGYNLTDINLQLDKYILKDINLLVIAEPVKTFTSSEIYALKNFLLEGGRLFIIGGTNEKVMNNLTSFLDITWLKNSETTTYTGYFAPDEVIFENVLELYYTTPYLTIESKKPATVLIKNDLDTSTLSVCSYYEQGKIFTITKGFLSDDVIGISYNTHFFNNLAMWLVKYPIAILAGSQTKINGELVSCEIGSELSIFEDDFIGFDGNDSVNPEWQTAELNFTWDFDDGIIGYGPLPAHKYVMEGEYNITLKVKTYDGFSDQAFITIKVTNVIPTPYPGYTKIDGMTVYFDASATKDTASDLSTLTYHWNFGDGQSGTGISPVHTYRSKDVYYVTLTVIDDNGARNESKFKLDLSDSKSRSLSTYYPAIGALIVLFIIIVVYMLIHKKKPGEDKDPRMNDTEMVEEKDESHVESTEEKPMRRINNRR